MPHLNETFAALCSHLTPQYCQTRKKLILVCDMDETLLTEIQSGDKILIRPKICYMLRSLRNLYELCMVTYSTRERTTNILKRFLDPDSKIFGHRVLCREDIVPRFHNKLDAFLAHLPKGFGKEKNPNREVVGNVNFRSSVNRRSFNRGFTTVRSHRPPVWTYIVALDDFPVAWSNLSTCIPIRPFLVDRLHRSRATKNEGTYVLSLQKFLTKLHSAVFRDSRPGTMQNDVPGERAPADSTRPSTVSAYSVISRIRRRPSQVHRFQALCHLDPGHLIDFDSHRTTPKRFTNQRPSSTVPVVPTVETSTELARKLENPELTENTGGKAAELEDFIIDCSATARDSYFASAGNDRIGSENEDTYSCVSPSKQLIRHVYKRARIIRDVHSQLGRV
ncbi:unnamed protein product [Calicophoron daubneyi]|uniref:FCP1 homology domain-containing protein n=1 Tax=Calicophoron daubneyi TaxID=300641 RepID=A0AAV2TLW7_CALDB